MRFIESSQCEGVEEVFSILATVFSIFCRKHASNNQIQITTKYTIVAQL